MKITSLVLFGSLFSLFVWAQPQRSLNALSKVSFVEKAVTLTGTLNGYNPAVDSFKYCSVIYNHLYKHDQQTHTGEIDKNGKFVITFPLSRPQEIMFEFGEDLVEVYAIPGSALDITLDLPAFKELAKLPDEQLITKRDPITFSGQYAQLNREFNLFSPIITTASPYTKHYPLIDSLDQLPYKTWRITLMQQLLDSLSAFNNRNNTSTEFRQLMTQRIRYSAADDLLRYRWMHNNKREKKEDVKLTSGYLDFLTDLPVNNEEAIISENYSSFLQEYILLSNAGKPDTLFVKPAEFIPWLKSEGKAISAAEEKILLTEGTPAPEQLKQQEAVFKKYTNEMNDYVEAQRLLHTFNAIAKNTPAGMGRDILLTNILSGHLENSRRPIMEAQLKTLSEQINNTNLRAQIGKDNERLKNVLAGNMPTTSHVRSGLQVSEDKFFAELIKPYKGKVVYIDFWAPWCGPCMGEMPASAALQKEFTGKDVVFLYIGISCSKQSWESTIKDRKLEGEHYYASENEGKLLMDKFNISGIPHYVLIDKEGKVKDDDAQRPSDKTKIIRRINDLVKK